MKNNERKEVRQPQPITRIINWYAGLDNLQIDLETPHKTGRQRNIHEK